MAQDPELPPPRPQGRPCTRDESDARSIGDAELAEKYARCEPSAFREIDSWSRISLSRSYPGLAGEHEDLCQTTHVRLLESLRRGRYAPDRSLRAYVTGIVHHVAIDHLRRGYRARALTERLSTDPRIGRLADPYDAAEARDENRLLREAILLVPTSCRELWKLMFVDRLTYEEIGRRLSIPAGTVKSRMWHCRRKANEALRRLRAARSRRRA